MVSDNIAEKDAMEINMSQIRIALVEDHHSVRQGYIKILASDYDFDVIGDFSNGESLLQNFEECRPEVVIMDIQLKGMSGIETTRLIKDKFPKTEVIILSMLENEESIFEAIRAGASGYLLKDATFEEIANAIKVVHSGDALMYPKITRKILDQFSRMSGRNAGNTAMPTSLAPQEINILKLISEGISNKEIAAQLNISEGTVKHYLRVIFRKMDVVDRAQAVAAALRRGLIS